ncbi:hypothetical protein MHYP_G00166880 [Metynnis hypsauchen]
MRMIVETKYWRALVLSLQSRGPPVRRRSHTAASNQYCCRAPAQAANGEFCNGWMRGDGKPQAAHLAIQPDSPQSFANVFGIPALAALWCVRVGVTLVESSAALRLESGRVILQFPSETVPGSAPVFSSSPFLLRLQALSSCR